VLGVCSASSDALCCSLLQSLVFVLQCVAVCCSVSQYVAMCCSDIL